MPAKQLTDDKVKMGVPLPVENQLSKPGQSVSYVVLHVQDEDGKEFPLMFAPSELNFLRAAFLTYLNTLDYGHLMPFALRGSGVKVSARDVSGYFVRTTKPINPRHASTTVLIPAGVFKLAKARAVRNPEDVPQKGRLTNLFD